MWPRRSEILAPLTCLTSKDVPSQWTDIEQQAPFDKINVDTKSAGKNVIEHAHQAVGNLNRSFQLEDKPYYDMDDPWEGILMAIAFVLRSMYHTTLQAMPGQLIFGRDMVLNVQHLTDWTAIKTRKQQIICNNNRIKNLKQIPHHYQVGDLVMLENNRANKYEQPYNRPYRITQVNMNGTVYLKINAVTDTLNM
jgi:hypothetical protein